MRVNGSNQGASFTRNVGMNESAAEFILFLDDDVIPSCDLVDEYIHAIRDSGEEYDGFVGYSELPPQPAQVFPTAVHLSGVSFFWRAAKLMKTMPWGITANLMVRRSACEKFDLAFIKTGGGEDIDFCLRLKHQPLLSVPKAVIVHPWWDNGNRCYKHFFNWSYSDGMLQDQYPRLTYRCFPDAVEFAVLAVTGALLCGQPSAGMAIAAITLMVDMALDFAHLYFDGNAEPYSVGYVRAVAVLESTLIKNTSAVGRVWGHAVRGRFANLCRRFDWFCGQTSQVVRGEQNKALWHFVVMAGAATVVVAAMQHE
jgi:glycosyltransferase involved in cell wall biosynthesis